MESYYYSEINENELLDDDRLNSETFEVGEVGDDWVPSMTLNDFGVRIDDDKQINRISKLEELMKSKIPLTVEEIEEVMMNPDFLEENNLCKSSEVPIKEEEVEFNNNRQRTDSHCNYKNKNHQNFLNLHRQKNNFYSNPRKYEEKSFNNRSNRNQQETGTDFEYKKESEPVPTLPYNRYIFPLTLDHINNIIKNNLSIPSCWKSPSENFNILLNNNLMVSKDFDIILRIQLQQMAERPEIQSYSSKWNRRLLARKHNLPINSIETNNEDFQRNQNQEIGDKNDKIKNRARDIGNEIDPNRIRKFGKSTYSTVRGARELIKVHNITKDGHQESNGEINDRDHSDQVKGTNGMDNSVSFRNSHYFALSRIVYDVLQNPIFYRDDSIEENNYDNKVHIPGPLVYSIIEAGNDLLQDISYFDDEIENCPTGHLQARLRLDQELRETIDLIFQLLFGFSKNPSFDYEMGEEEVLKNEDSFGTNELLHNERAIAPLKARRWLINKIISIRKGRYFILNLFYMSHISENYITILLESIVACNKYFVEIFRSSSIILPPLMALVPRVFRHRQGQDIMAPHEGFGYTGDIDQLIDDWRTINEVTDRYNDNYVTREDLIVRAKLGVKILETTALLSNRMMQSNVYRDSSLVPSVRALVKYYKPDFIKQLLPYSSGVVFFALLYNSISVTPRQYDLLKELTGLLVTGFTDYLIEKDADKNAKMPINLSPSALKNSEPVVLCVLQRSTNDNNLRSILMNSIASVVGKENTDSFISELQGLIVKGTSRN